MSRYARPLPIKIAGSLFVFFSIVPPSARAAELQASNGAALGTAAAVFGSTALVGTHPGDERGEAFLFRNVDTASGIIPENL